MERCPYLIVKQAGDESFEYCDIKLRPQPCIGEECEDYPKESSAQNDGS